MVKKETKSKVTKKYGESSVALYIVRADSNVFSFVVKVTNEESTYFDGYSFASKTGTAFTLEDVAPAAEYRSFVIGTQNIVLWGEETQDYLPLPEDIATIGNYIVPAYDMNSIVCPNGSVASINVGDEIVITSDAGLEVTIPVDGINPESVKAFVANVYGKSFMYVVADSSDNTIVYTIDLASGKLTNDGATYKVNPLKNPGNHPEYISAANDKAFASNKANEFFYVSESGAIESAFIAPAGDEPYVVAFKADTAAFADNGIIKVAEGSAATVVNVAGEVACVTLDDDTVCYVNIAEGFDSVFG